MALVRKHEGHNLRYDLQTRLIKGTGLTNTVAILDFHCSEEYLYGCPGDVSVDEIRLWFYNFETRLKFCK